MQNGFLILISVLAFSANQMVTRFFQLKLQKTKHSILIYQALFCLVASAAYFGVTFFKKTGFSLNILLSAILFGLCFAFAVLFSAKCMEMGYMSLSSVIINMSLILPVMFSWIVLKEKIEKNAVIGLLLIIVTLVLSSLSEKDNSEGRIKKWLLFVIIAFVANGGSAIVQKQYISNNSSSYLMPFMGTAYAVSALIFAVCFIKKNKAEKLPFKEQIEKPCLLFVLAVISGLGSFGGNGILGFLCNRVNGGVLYPCINGGLCVVIALYSFVIFKEEFNVKKLAAIIIGLAAIVLLNL